MSQILRKLGSIFKYGRPSWSQIENFNPEWKNRIRLMASYISPVDSVVDLGCGKGWLKEFLAPSNRYMGVDYKRRDNETILCDFNKHEFPDVVANVYFVSGCLEYIKNFEPFIEKISIQCDRCIISYCCVEDFFDLRQRRKRGWLNNLTRMQLIELFLRHRMRLKAENKTESDNSIFVFAKDVYDKT